MTSLNTAFVVRKLLFLPEDNPLTPRVKPWVVLGFLTFEP